MQGACSEPFEIESIPEGDQQIISIPSNDGSGSVTRQLTEVANASKDSDEVPSGNDSR